MRNTHYIPIIFLAYILSSNAIAEPAISIDNETSTSTAPLTKTLTISNPGYGYNNTYQTDKDGVIDLSTTIGSADVPLTQPSDQLNIDIIVYSNGTAIEHQQWKTSNTGQNAQIVKCDTTLPCCADKSVIWELDSGDGGTHFTIAYYPNVTGICGGTTAPKVKAKPKT